MRTELTSQAEWGVMRERLRARQHGNTGHELWRELHEWAWAYPESAEAGDMQTAREWLAGWSRRLPRSRCNCSAGWASILAACPPALEGRAAFYWWTVAAHDAVNAKLRKPLAAPEWSLRHPLLAPYLGERWLRTLYPEVVTLTQLS